MSNIKLFESTQIRSVWLEDEQKWFFSVVDVVQVLTESVNPTDYLKKLRKRDPELGSYLGTNCPQVAMRTDSGVQRQTLAGSVEHLLRIIQSGQLVTAVRAHKLALVEEETCFLCVSAAADVGPPVGTVPCPAAGQAGVWTPQTARAPWQGFTATIRTGPP